MSMSLRPFFAQGAASFMIDYNMLTTEQLLISYRSVTLRKPPLNDSVTAAERFRDSR